MAFVASLQEYATSSMLPNLVESCIELIATIKPSPPTPHAFHNHVISFPSILSIPNHD